jgi:hypothetical protein
MSSSNGAKANNFCFCVQVKFKIDGDFMPIPESSLRNAINDNYFNGRFNPELTATQVSMDQQESAFVVFVKRNELSLILLCVAPLHYF